MDEQRIDAFVKQALDGTAGRVTVLTGAGISAESGIPTFRGPEGYWTVGSTVYQPQQMATAAMFRKHPEAVWSWYLYRIGVCAAARPNTAHRALAALEQHLQERFLLITQNVDGLHLRAGSSLQRTYQIHGNIFFVRCSGDCGGQPIPLPEGIEPLPAGQHLTADHKKLLACPRCGAWLRPHVLWFDETYDEPLFRFHSSLEAAARTDLLVVVGTSGATNLPLQVAATVAAAGRPIVDIDPSDNPFSRLAIQTGGVHDRRPATEAMVQWADAIARRTAGRS